MMMLTLLKKGLQKGIFLSKDSLGFAFYHKKQHYRVRYTLRLRNRNHSPHNATVIFPLPRESNTQIITNKPLFFPDTPVVYSEEKFSNTYALWPAVLRPGQEIEYGYTFSVLVMPQRYKAERGAIKDSHTTIQTLKALNEHVVEYLEYGNPIEGLYSSTYALKRRIVDCGGFNSLLIALAQKAGIGARLVSGFWAGYPARVVPGFSVSAPKHTMHVWSEFLLPDGQWIGADPSAQWLLERGRGFYSGRLGFLGSDRIRLSVGSHMKLRIGNGRTTMVDILQNPIVISDHGVESFEKQVLFTTKRL